MFGAKKKKKKQVPHPDTTPPTLGEYLAHIFDNNALRTIEPEALTDAQFFWLLSDLGLGLSSDEITVLCRRAPQSNGKVDWATFAPRAEELLLQTFRTRDWNTVKSKGESEYAKLVDPRNPASTYFYNRQNGEVEWEDVKDEEQDDRTKGYVTRPLPTLPPDKADLPGGRPPGSPDPLKAKRGFGRGELPVKVPPKGAIPDPAMHGVVWPPQEEADEDFDPSRAAKLRKTQLLAAKRLEGQKDRPKPPGIAAYLATIFRENDGSNRGAFTSDEFMECMMGLGFGLSKQDITALFKKAEKNYDAEMLWPEWTEGSEAVLKEVFKRQDYKKRGESPWVRLNDPQMGAPYFMNRTTLEMEWASGEPGQAARLKDAIKPTLGGACLRLVEKHPPPSIDVYIDRMYRDPDTDGSAALSPEEVWWVFQSLGLGLTDADLRTLRQNVEDDFDGEVPWKEFAKEAKDWLEDLFEKDKGVVKSPYAQLNDPDSGARFLFNRVDGEVEWVTGDKEQTSRVGEPFKAEMVIPKPDPPSLEEYLFRMFARHDVDESGDCTVEDLGKLLSGLGLGLTEDDVKDLMETSDAASTAERKGKFDWEEHLPELVLQLEGIFTRRNWDLEDTAFVKMFDELSGQAYFFNRETGDQEWSDGTTAQCNRVGIFPVLGEDPNSPGSGGGMGITPWGAPVEKVDPDGADQPLPFGGRQLLDALALGEEDRARAILRGLRSDKRRQRVLGSVRVARFGFTAAHVAATCCGIELMQDLLHLAPQLIDFPALNGDTPLHVACLWKRRNTARLLVALGAQITTKNQDGETPIDLAPPKLGQRLIRDLNSILASWKGPLPYPNHGMGDDLAMSEAAKKRRATERALQAAEEEQEANELAFKLQQEKEKAEKLRLALEGPDQEEEEDEEEDEGPGHAVEKWLKTAPTVASIEEAGRNVYAPNELVVRIYGAAGLFPPQVLVRQGKLMRFFEENLKPAAIVHAERVHPADAMAAAEAVAQRQAGQPITLGGFLGNDAAKVGITKPRGEQGPIARSIGGSGWCSEAGLLLDRTGLRGVASARGTGSDGSALSPAWAEQFTIPDDRFIEAKIAIAADAAVRNKAAADLAAGKKKKKKRPGDDDYVGGAWDRSGGGELKLRVCVAHWPSLQVQEAEAKRRKKPRNDGRARPLSLRQPVAIGSVEIPIDAWTHVSTLAHPETGEPLPKPPIPAQGGANSMTLVPKEFRAWLPVVAPSRHEDAVEAGPERREVERKALIAGLMAKAGGRPPKKDISTGGYDAETMAALAPTPLYVSAGGSADPKVAKATGGTTAVEARQAWEESSQDCKPAGFKDARRFLEAERAERQGEDFNAVFVKAMELQAKEAAALANAGRRKKGKDNDDDDGANDDDGDRSDSSFEGDDPTSGAASAGSKASTKVGFDDDEEEDPLLGHPVRVRDAATIAALALEAEHGVVHRAKEKSDFNMPYATMSSGLQLGEFAGFVSGAKQGEADNIYVLLDSALKSEDYAYGRESDEEDGVPAPLRRATKPRRDPPVSDSAVTIFRKRDVTFVPASYGALQVGCFWRYNPALPPAKLPEASCVVVTEELLFEVLVGMINSIGQQSYKDAQDAPFALETFQGGDKAEGSTLLETMQSQQLMQMQLMQQMQKMQLDQLKAVHDVAHKPPPVIVQEVRPRTPPVDPKEQQRLKEEENFRNTFVSAFQYYEGERFPINYLQPVDIATLFEHMGFARCIPKVLEAPIDGPTLGLLGDEDFKQLGLELPAQRRRMMAEIALFLELGAPLAKEVNPESLANYTDQMQALEQLRYDDFQSVLSGAPPPPDPNLLIQLQMQQQAMLMMNQMDGLQKQIGQGGRGQPAQVESIEEEPVEPEYEEEAVPAVQAKPTAKLTAKAVDEPPPPKVIVQGAGDKRPSSADPGYLEALEDALDHLPKVFCAAGEKGKVHKVRATAELESEVVGELKAGDDVVVKAASTAMNTKGEEVDRYEVSAPVMGWVSAGNFKFVMDSTRQQQKYMDKLESMLKAKDKKKLKAIEDAKKKAAKEAEKQAKKEAEQAKKDAKDAPRLEKERLKREKEEAAAKAKADAAAEKAGKEKKDKDDCYGAWVAKGDKGVENTVRKDAAMDSMKVGKVLGGTKVNVIGQTTVTKADGNAVVRLLINNPKAGWISAANFDQVIDPAKEAAAKAEAAAAGVNEEAN